jgi:TPR repeat protein
MLTASELGDDEATIILVVAGIRSGNFRDYEKPLKKLGVMAKEGNPRAMTLSGRIAASQGGNKEALGWFRKATQGPTGLDFEEAGEALVCEGQLLMKDDTKAAQAVLRKAALELDDPSAYFYLAELEEKGSQSQAVYLMKAASSGIIEAAHELGSIELSKTTKASEGNSPPSYGIAREWFQLAAVGDYGPSMLQLAQICKESGEPDEGLKWLEKAKKREDVREQALQMRDSWEL